MCQYVKGPLSLVQVATEPNQREVGYLTIAENGRMRATDTITEPDIEFIESISNSAAIEFRVLRPWNKRLTSTANCVAEVCEAEETEKSE